MKSEIFYLFKIFSIFFHQTSFQLFFPSISIEKAEPTLTIVNNASENQSQSTDTKTKINIHPTGVFGVMFFLFFVAVIIIGSMLPLDTGGFNIPLKEKKSDKRAKAF